MKLKLQLAKAVIFIVCLIADQAAGYYAYSSGFGSFLNSFKPWFGKLLLPNQNFAFGMPLPHFFAYTIFAIVFVLFTAWYFSGPKNWKEHIGFWMIAAGAASNLYDRIILGYVRDYIYAFWGSVFNLSDLMIVTGILLIVLSGAVSNQKNFRS